jgi:hypothetical protein
MTDRAAFWIIKDLSRLTSISFDVSCCWHAGENHNISRLTARASIKYADFSIMIPPPYFKKAFLPIWETGFSVIIPLQKNLFKILSCEFGFVNKAIHLTG